MAERRTTRRCRLRLSTFHRRSRRLQARARVTEVVPRVAVVGDSAGRYRSANPRTVASRRGHSYCEGSRFTRRSTDARSVADTCHRDTVPRATSPVPRVPCHEPRAAAHHRSWPFAPRNL